MLVASIFFLFGTLTCTFWKFPVVEMKRSIPVLLTLFATTLGCAYHYDIVMIGWLTILVLLDLYILFYAKEYNHYITYCVLQLATYVLVWGALALMGGKQVMNLLPILFTPLLYLVLLWIQGRRKLLLFAGVILFTSIFFFFGLVGYDLLMQACTLLLIYLLESVYSGIYRNFNQSTKEFQDHVMLHHYDEVKSVYLNMRGWRHDYHNHIQTLKAYLSLEEYSRMKEYLGELEKDLDCVDNLIKSGNLMIDAILNSKLSLANSHDIKVTSKMVVPEKISITDIDICVMIGNLLDNAIEACERIEKEKRFIRIYGDIVHSQFYFSVLNSAEDELNFNQKNYISEKRGEHGHGMKRVRLTVDKYEGYLKLENEPGVFACELMIPIE